MTADRQGCSGGSSGAAAESVEQVKAERDELRRRLALVRAALATSVVAAPAVAGEGRWDRATVLQVIAETMRADPDLPEIEDVSFSSSGDHVGIDLVFGHGQAGITAWAVALGVTPEDLKWIAQPYPLKGDYQHWSSYAVLWRGWHGWTLDIKASEPVTDAHVRQWVESGQAQRWRDHLAQREAGQPESTPEVGAAAG